MYWKCSEWRKYGHVVEPGYWPFTFSTCFLWEFSFSLWKKSWLYRKCQAITSLLILLGGRLASALFLSPSSAHHKHHEQRQCDPTHFFFLNTYQRGERTRKSFTLSIWAGLTDVCWTPRVICFLQFLSLSLSLSLFLSLCLHFFWFLPCVSSDTFLHENSWRKTEASLLRCCDFKTSSAGKIAKLHSRNMSYRLQKTWWNSNLGVDDCLAGLILSSFSGYVVDII